MTPQDIRFARSLYNGEGKCVDAKIAYWLNEIVKIRARKGTKQEECYSARNTKDEIRFCLQAAKRYRAMKRDFLAFEALDKLFYASIEAYCKIPKEAESARKVVENAIRNTIKEKDGFIDNWAEVKGAHNRGHEWFKKQYRKR